MARRIISVLGVVAVAAVAGLSFVGSARAQSKRVEYVRLDLASTFQPSPQNTAVMVRGLLVLSDGDMHSQDFRIPVDIPVGWTVTEMGVIGQTSNRLAVKLERQDWTPVYTGSATQSEIAGSWTCIELLDRSLTRKVEKPKWDDEKTKAQTVTREKAEHEIDVVVYMSRDPNLSPDSRRSSAQNQRDKVQAIWLKVEHP
jgi:hypothetical protein